MFEANDQKFSRTLRHSLFAAVSAVAIGVALTATAITSNTAIAQSAKPAEALAPDQHSPLRSSVKPEELDAYDRAAQRDACFGGRTKMVGNDKVPVLPPEGGNVRGYWGTYMNSPILADRLRELGVFYRTRGTEPGSYTHADREWIDVVMGAYIHMTFPGHDMDGVAVGIRPEAVLAVLENHEQDLTADERRTAQIIRNFVDGKLVPGDWEYLQRRFGIEGAVEYTSFMGFLLMTMRVTQTFSLGAPHPADTGPRPTPEEQTVKLVREAMKDKSKLPDPNRGIPTFKFTPGKC